MNSVNEQRIKRKYEEIVSSLGLQVSLYFHWRYSIVYVSFYVIKFIAMNEDIDFSDLISVFVPVILALWSVIEISRIYLGYAGNLGEQVPHLFGFLFLSIFPQSILIILMMVLPWNRPNHWVVDKVLNVFQILFILSQLGFGYIAIKKVIQAQTLKFKIKTNQRIQQQQQKLLGQNNKLCIDQSDIKED
eukprot:45370_1